MTVSETEIHWKWTPFESLSSLECWSMLELRQNVFLLEQKCRYADVDRMDLESEHLFGWAGPSGNKLLAAYQRLVPPNFQIQWPSLGRIVIHPDFRGLGIGKTLVQQGIEKSRTQFPDSPIFISAQQHLEQFYSDLGFRTKSEPYLDAGIPHIKMLLPGDGKNR